MLGILFLMLISLNISAREGNGKYVIETKKNSTDTVWIAYTANTVESLPGFKCSKEPDKTNYGGWKVMKQKATGFFRTQKIDNRWWIIDPKGYPFIHKAVVAFNPGKSEKQQAAFREKYATTGNWVREEISMLESYGINGVGAWTELDILREQKKPLVYTVIVSPMGEYKKEHIKKYGGKYQTTSWQGYRYDLVMVFDKEFDTYIEKTITPISKYKNDKYLLGYFTDNELPWVYDALDRHLTLLAKDEQGYIAAKKWFDQRKGRDSSPDDITDEDRSAFTAFYFDTYMQKVTTALRKADPNHMYLGCRFNQDKNKQELTNPEIFKVAGKYMDIISINHYRKWEPDQTVLDNWGAWAGKPFLITEWYTKAEDSDLPNSTGAGWLVPTQRDRGYFYQNFTLGLLQNKNCVGWHWFKYMDNDPDDLTADPSNRDSNKGVVDRYFNPYIPLLEEMKKINVNTFNLINYFDSKGNIETRIEEILSGMTLRQKIGQMNQLNARVPDEKLYAQIRNGEVGSILNAEDPQLLNKLQEIAVKESQHGIPLIFARDVIHGFKTIFPIPLGQAASFNPDIVEKGSRVAAIEASENGIRWTFAPMMDVSRDPRWGRIAESFGEDTYLSEIMGAAMVRGFQGGDLSQSSSIAACAKHFIGYGAVEGGRDYNVTYLSERQLRKTYLPPFLTAIKDADCATIMTSFNSNDGVPPSGNKFLLRDILREEWKFDGVVVSDWASISMMITQGFCDSKKEAALKAVDAGLDVDMVSTCYIDNLEQLVNEGQVKESLIDVAVKNILRLKLRLGLFENPYTDLAKEKKIYSEEHLQEAKKAAEESFVLLKNKNSILPVQTDIKNIAIIGPLADVPHDQMGTWCFDGEKSMTRTPLHSLKEMYGNQANFIYEPGLAFSRDENKDGIRKAVEAAQKADMVFLFIGEESILSGEAHSLACLDLVGAQSDLIEELSKTNKPIVTIVMAGRPLTIEKEIALSDAVLYAWHPGTMGGPAIADVLFGKSYPSGKLPVTFPRTVGQIPFYYSYEKIGRPAKKTEKLLDQIPLEAKQSSLGNTSYYLDAGFDALYDFGYGLSYTTFEYSNLNISAKELSASDTLTVTVDLKNTGKREGCEVMQLYIFDVAASVATSNKELKDFKRIILQPGEKRTVSFQLPISKLALWNIDMNYVVEPGRFKLMIGGNSNEGVRTEFRVR